MMKVSVLLYITAFSITTLRLYSTTALNPQLSSNLNKIEFGKEFEIKDATVADTISVDETTIDLVKYNQNRTLYNDSDLVNSFSLTTPLADTTDFKQYILNSSQSYQDDICLELSSCEAAANTSDSFPRCNCDDSCADYGDCCLEYSTNESTNGDQRPFTCIPDVNYRKDSSGFFAITDCPLDCDNKTVHAYCKENNIQEHGPPVVYNNTVVYMNKYCALCHNVTPVTSFNIRFLSKFQSSKKLYDTFGDLSKADKIRYLFANVKYQLLPPVNTVIRRCLPNLIENNNPFCRQYVNPVVKGLNDIYRNYFCVPKEDNVRMDCYNDQLFGRDINLYALSVIFLFGEKEETETRQLDQCKEWKEEMAYTNMCSGYETVVNDVIVLQYFLTSDTNMTIEEVYRLVTIFAWTFVIPEFTKLENDFVLQKTTIDSKIFKVKVFITITKRSFRHEISSLENIYKDRTVSIQFRQFTNNDMKTILIQEVSKKALTTDHIIFQHTEDLQYNELITQYDTPSLNKGFIKLCGYIFLDITSKSNGTLQLNSLTCAALVPTSKNYVLAVLTYVTFSASVAALIGLIIYYRTNKLTTTIAGSNLENLSVALIVTNLLFMFGIGATTTVRVCYVISVTLHYLWLNVFTYMTISVTYIVSNIVQMKSRFQISDETTKRRRRIVTVIGFLIPMLFVGPAVLTDKFGPDNLSPGYAGSVCFPNRYPGNVIFFSGPVVLSLGINAVCLVQIVIQICRVRLEMRNIRKSASYRDAKIYLRIVILSGIFWIIDILAAILQIDWLDYVFTILCGLQGFFIAVANLTTTRVKCWRKISRSLEIFVFKNENTKIESLSKFE